MADKLASHAKWLLVLGSINAALAVALGAAARHTLQPLIAINDPAGWFAVALDYHRYHALGLIAVGLATTLFPSRWFAAAGWLLLAGMVLFCGNLYLRSLGGIHSLHALTPVGGAAFILGWLAFAVGALRLSAQSRPIAG